MPRIGFQMIMLSRHSDFAGALKTAAAMGYEIAEPWGWKPPVSCMEQHRLGEAAGLTICSGHYIPSTEWVKPHVEELADQLAAAKARAWTMAGGYGGDTVEAMQASAAKLRQFYLDVLAPRGLKVEYHNHATDIQPRFDGKTQVDILLESVPELGFQPDTGNAFVGGQTDTLAFLRHYGDRITCLHVKDIREEHQELESGHGRCAVGEGVLDIAGAVAYARSLGVEDFIVEQEGGQTDAEIEGVLERSYASLSALL
ncbi:MAG: sugar phosphate isomerase/epimerase [Victivallales bacterium]|nr:sugar phosphate isomerase/epimerase [Victivallales bacterium]MBT7163631.1 sugar phosphate isomerase/epimerase [Victivallales bacterium]